MVAVGRLVPVKRFDLLIEALVEAEERRHPALTAPRSSARGTSGPSLEALIRRPRGVLVDRAPRVSSTTTGWSTSTGGPGWWRPASLREGWGMTVTEAGACGTPAVASRISGHRDAVVEGESGLLVADRDEMVAALDARCSDEVLRRRLGVGALEHAGRLTWDATARGTLAALGTEALSRTD